MGVEVETGLEVRDVFHLLVVPGLDLDGVRLGGRQVVGGGKAHAKVGVILKTNEMGVCTSKSNRTDHGSKKDKGQEEMHSSCVEKKVERGEEATLSPPSPPRIQRTPKLFKAPDFPRDINLGRRCMMGAITCTMPGVRLDRMLRQAKRSIRETVGWHTRIPKWETRENWELDTLWCYNYQGHFMRLAEKKEQVEWVVLCYFLELLDQWIVRQVLFLPPDLHRVLLQGPSLVLRDSTHPSQ